MGGVVSINWIQYLLKDKNLYVFAVAHNFVGVEKERIGRSKNENASTSFIAAWVTRDRKKGFRSL